ncbi:J domain-containing protein [Pararhodospirillum oryzae]|uniref:Molecular chaperone DnaJ n=1 Tax=Pararhodospirillum oryzae TaxID=478448 RepID=A0A512HB20_9PROT|nr:J domain-containing protein [Pararhodospirillum oryzae]GEO82580.1 molecular chaperone DnaJ [Pararhodospirillum oryzae]
MAIEVKHSYTVPCASAFRDATLDLAYRRRVNAGDLARSVMLVVPPAVVEATEDPGEPPPGDREIVILKSGPSAGRPWRRKPRLQVRMVRGYTVPFVRKALAVALALDSGALRVLVDGEACPPLPAILADSIPQAPPPAPEPPPPPPGPDLSATVTRLEAEIERLRQERDRLRGFLPLLTGDTLPEGVGSREEALYVLGFPPGSDPDLGVVRSRFRQLATVLHPDSGLGDNARMSQLNQAMAFLRGR